jgi:hypothetical protein
MSELDSTIMMEPKTDYRWTCRSCGASNLLSVSTIPTQEIPGCAGRDHDQKSPSCKTSDLQIEPVIEFRPWF